MTNKLKLTLLGLALMIAGSSLVPVAKADEWNKETIVTFSEPVQVPSKVLQAGTYVFKLADTISDRHIVQIWSADEDQLFATIMTIPNTRFETPERPIFEFDERPSDSPPALKVWFYPGNSTGEEFVYSRYSYSNNR